MAEEIRGLNVKFDADFSEFKKGMRDANKDISSTQKQLKTLQESLSLKWDTQKFKQAQDQARKAIEATDQKAVLLRERLSEIEKAGVTDKTRNEYNYLSEELNKTELEAQKLNQRLKDLEDIRLSNLTAGLDKVSAGLDKAAQKTRLVSSLAAGIAAGVVGAGLKTVEYADNIATLATQYDMSTDALQRFNYVALQTDTQAEYLYKAFVKVEGGVADLKSGVESISTKALDQLGLSFDQFDNKEERFYAIIDALSKMEDEAKMVSIANDIFGERMATNLFPLIYAGSEAINEYRQEFEELGALTEEQISQLSEFDNVLNTLKTRYKNLALDFGSSVLPLLESLSDSLERIIPKIQSLVHWFDNLSPEMKDFIFYGLLATAMLSPMLSIMSNIAGAASSIVSGLNGMNAAFSVMSKHPIILILAVIAGLLLLMYTRNEEFRESLNNLLDILNESAIPAFNILANLIGGILDMVGPLIDALGNGLAPVLELICAILEPIANLLATILNLINQLQDGIFRFLGKGTIWGKNEDKPSSGNAPENSYDVKDIIGNFDIPDIPDYPAPSNTSNNYVDNSNVVINIEKNDYMSEEDIIRAVNSGLKKARQSRK